MLEEHRFQKSWHLILYFLTFVLHFKLDPIPNPVPGPEPEGITVPVAVQLKQKLRFLRFQFRFRLRFANTTVKYSMWDICGCK